VAGLFDPLRGAFSNLEYAGLSRKLHEEFSKGTITLDRYAISLLNLGLGLRNIQIATLRVEDLIVTSEKITKKYKLRVPRVKQHGGCYRKQFTERPLNDEFGVILAAQATRAMQVARRMGEHDESKVPMFPSGGQTTHYCKDVEETLSSMPAIIGMQSSSTLNTLGVVSERTGEPIVANSSRCRMTVGTRAAQDGRSAEEIAQILDHTSLRSAKFYVGLRSEMVSNIDRKLALLLAPLAQRFAGTLVSRQGAARQSGGMIIGVATPGEAPVLVGGCNKCGHCGLVKPVACYSCRLFTAWIEGPHEEVLRDLILRREKMIELGSDSVATSLDETIIACAEIVQRCAELRDNPGVQQ
jgi:hypothetical protein